MNSARHMSRPPSIEMVFMLLVLVLAGCTRPPSTRPALTASVLPTLTPTHVAALTTPGIAVYFPFDGNANDVSGSQNSSQVSGAARTSDRFGTAAHAYHFDGVDDYIAFDGSKLPLGTSPRTISAWIRAESFPPEAFAGLGSRATVIGWGIDDEKRMSEMQIVNGKLTFHCYGADPSGSAVLELNRWYHLAITYAEGTVSLYVDGAEDIRAPATIDTSAGPARIGAFPDPKTHGFDATYFHGTIDEVSIYSRALSAAQIKELYSEGGWGGP